MVNGQWSSKLPFLSICSNIFFSNFANCCNTFSTHYNSFAIHCKHWQTSSTGSPFYSNIRSILCTYCTNCRILLANHYSLLVNHYSSSPKHYSLSPILSNYFTKKSKNRTFYFKNTPKNKHQSQQYQGFLLVFANFPSSQHHSFVKVQSFFK
jgi:hypothetical protein